MYKILKKCRNCNSEKIKDILDLGAQPLANDLRRKILNLKKIPLKIVRCNKCSLIQLNATVKPSILFSKYFWVTGTSETIKNYRTKFINKIRKKHNLSENILEIASNDGFFLQGLKEDGFKNILGIDPAKNIATAASKKGIKTLPNFFNFKNSQKIKKKFKPDVIICRNVIPHVENIKDVLAGINNMISRDGNVYIEFHYAKNLVNRLHYDYIYHEHIFYYTIKSLENILKKFHLNIFDCFLSPISGGSIVIVASKKNKRKTKFLISKIRQEKKINLNSYLYWKKFGNKCNNHKIKVLKLIKKLNINCNTAVGYGASARSSTFLNFCKLTGKQFKFILDKNKLKNKLYTPGSRIKIKYLNKNLLKNIKFVIILAWNFEKEIVKYLKSLKYKGKIITFLPKISVKKI